MDSWRYEFEHLSPEEKSATEEYFNENPDRHPTPPAKMSLEEAMTRAKAIIENWVGEWPEDDWVGVSEDWDLNVYSEDDERGATLYPVFDGNTCTSTEYAVM